VNSRNAAVVLCALTLVAACSDDDGGGQQTLPPGPTTTPATAPPSATPLPTGTSPPTSDPPTTTEPPTTVAPTTTISQEAEEARIKRQVARAYVAAFDHQVRLVTDPPRASINRRVAQHTVRGSPANRELVDFLRDLVAAGDRIVVEDQSQNRTIVETVSLDGSPARSATVTHCTVLSQERVHPRPDGTSPIVGQPAGLRSFRAEAVLHWTPGGWKHYERVEGLLDAWPGENRCA
jgi:hypothetical protein